MTTCFCGCCEGIQAVTPVPAYNRPGLPAIAYRAGTYARFRESMLARLSGTRYPQLARLTTREPGDAAIALLDCWAVVADVLTFYSERIANEGYLRTATELESLTHLGRLVGYTPRPALASSSYLAYTLSPGATVTIPAGSQAKSVPPPGGTPQTFETAEDLDAREEWNTIEVRRTTSPTIKPGELSTLDQLELAGVVNLKTGDRMLFSFGAAGNPESLAVHGVQVDATRGRTAVSFVSPSPTGDYPARIIDIRTAIRDARADGGKSSVRYRFFTDYILPITRYVGRAGAPPPPSARIVTGLARGLRTLAEARAIAGVHQVGEIVSWSNLERVAEAGAAVLAAATSALGKSPKEIQDLRTLAPDGAALAGLVPVLPALRKPPSIPPASPRDLPQKAADPFAPGSDTWARLLTAADPRLAANLYQAWASEPLADPLPLSSLQVMRITARLFDPQPSPMMMAPGGGAAPAAPVPTMSTLLLDAVYDGIVAGTLAIVEGTGTPPIIRQITDVSPATGTITQGDQTVNVTATRITLAGAAIAVPDVRAVTVWARGEEVRLAADPDPDDVAGNEIQLARVYDGLQPGRWLIVSGERTDIPYTTGVQASELVMLGGVSESIPTAPGDSLRSTLLLVNELAYSYKRDSVTVYANVVPATQGESRTEVLGSGDGAKTGQSFPLRQVTQQAPLTYLPADNPLGAQDTLTARVNGVAWNETGSLVWAGPADHSYVIGTGAGGQPSVTFGDGAHGARLPTGVENVTATYRIGAGASGDLPAGTISQLVSRPLGVSAVVNPVPATGGTDADGPADARATTPLRVLALDRLVSVRDYENFTRARAGMGKASARRLFDGEREVVHVTIAAAGDAPVDPGARLFTALEAALADFGDPHLPLRVAVRELLLIVLSASVKVLPDYSWDLVEPAARAVALDTFGFTRRELGQPAYLSEAVAAIQGVPGVDYIDVTAFGYVPGDMDPVELAAVIKKLRDVSRSVPARRACYELRTHTTDTDETLTSVARAYGISVDDLLRLNLGLTSPGLHANQVLVVRRGISPAQLAILSPKVPETLILRRIP
jgi:predicted phage baseplate assembly protein